MEDDEDEDRCKEEDESNGSWAKGMATTDSDRVEAMFKMATKQSAAILAKHSLAKKETLIVGFPVVMLDVVVVESFNDVDDGEVTVAVVILVSGMNMDGGYGIKGNKVAEKSNCSQKENKQLSNDKEAREGVERNYKDRKRGLMTTTPWQVAVVQSMANRWA